MMHPARHVLACLLACLPGLGAEWVESGRPHWGLANGLQFALHPAGFGAGAGGPRGLIRIGAPVLPGGGHALVNFIAVEPVVDGRRGFSELEQSKLDGVQGKRFWSEGVARSSPAPGVEEIAVRVGIEAFRNGARLGLTIHQRSDSPDEIRLTVHERQGSAGMAGCILTATMGNLVRTRRLWLADRVLSSLALYPDHRDTGFAPHTVRSLPQLARTDSGDAIAAVTGDETEPSRVFPFPGRKAWHYAGAPVTQYWRVPASHVRDDLRVAVNARHTYWKSEQPIPGGVAFENFELRTAFVDGQPFVFGVTRRPPAELGVQAWRRMPGGATLP